MPIAFPRWGFVLLEGSVVGVAGDPEELAALAENAPEEAHVAASTFYQPEARRVERAVRECLESSARAVVIGPGLSIGAAEFQFQARLDCVRAAREGRLVVLASQDLAFLERSCDEIIVLRQGAAAQRGDPREIAESERRRIAESLREHGGGLEEGRFTRRGDGRARLVSLALLDQSGAPTSVVSSGEEVDACIRLTFVQDVATPVIGILIRNRIGVTVYGTNTELERLDFGPCAAGDELEVRFRFRCDLCPHEYTLTAASHDPDGAAHDWLEEALLFTVNDARYTAGVANLRARVTVKRLSSS